MDGKRFDRVVRTLSVSRTRRGLLGVLTGLPLVRLLTLSSGDALAKPHRTSSRGRLRTEACIPTGKPCPSKKPRGHNRHGKARTLSCKQCCQGHVTTVAGVTTCACQPDTQTCTTTTECCAGVCSNGSCVANPPPPPPICSELGQTCTVPGDACCPTVDPNVLCAGSSAQTCQDCTQAPTAAGALCQDPVGNQCCGGDATCFSGVRVDGGQPACFANGHCRPALNPCTQDSDCVGDPGFSVCVQGSSNFPCNCDGATPTYCGLPCPAA